MIVGKGVRWSEPFSELKELAESLGMPFLTSPMGRGFIPDDHPLCFGAARSMAQRGRRCCPAGWNASQLDLPLGHRAWPRHQDHPD